MTREQLEIALSDAKKELHSFLHMHGLLMHTGPMNVQGLNQHREKIQSIQKQLDKLI